MSQAEEDAGMAGEAMADIASRCLGDTRAECPACQAEAGQPCDADCTKSDGMIQP